MPDPHSHPSPSRKLGGIPDGDDASPTTYRKPSTNRMQAIPRPEDQPASPDGPGGGSSLLGLLAVILLLGGGAAYLYFHPPSQLTALLQPGKETPARARVTGLAAPIDNTPLATPAEGYVWLFDESEWRTPADAGQEYKEGLLRLRTIMEKPQPAADAEIHARIVIREGGGTAGVFLRSTPEEGRYRLAIDADLRFVRLVHESAKGTQELGKHRFFKSLIRGDRLVLELRAQGDRISGTVNGERVIEADDVRSFKAGTYGIEATDGWYELVEVPKPAPKVVADAAPPAPVEPAAPMPATPAPAPMPEAPPVVLSETGKWLAGMEPQWQAAFEREVVGPYQKSMTDLRAQFQGVVETEFAAATQAKKYDDIAFFRGEKKRLEAGEDVPMTDEPIVPPALVKLRTGFRAERSRFERERFVRAKTFFAKIELQLTQAQNALVVRQRAVEVAEVKAKRDQLAALWVKPPASAATPAPVMAMAAATPAPVRLPMGSTPAPSQAKLPPRQVVEKLLAIGVGVWVTQKGPANAANPPAATQVKAVADLAGERFVISRVDFRREGGEEKPITTEDLAILEALPEIVELGLHGPAVTDAVLEKLRTFRRLERLTIEAGKITTAGAAVFAALPDLRELHLRGMGLGDEGVKVLGQCRRLERLSLASLPITDAALAPLGKLPMLEELDLTGADKLTSAGFGHLAEIHTLKRLNVSGSRVSSPVLEAIGRCTALENLNLAGNAMKDTEVAGLATLTRLKTLNLSNTGLVGTAFATWPARGSMTTLNFTNEPGVNDAALKAIGAAFPKLDVLDISGVPLGATAEGFASIARLHSLRTLRVGGGLVNDEIMAEIGKCGDLTSLSIPGGRLSDPGAAALTKLSKLTTLDLNLPPVTEPALKSFSRCKALKTIQIAADAPENVEKKLRGALNGVTIRK